MKTCLLYGPIHFTNPDPIPSESKSKLYRKVHSMLYEFYQNGYGTFLCDLRDGANFWMGNVALNVKNRHPGMELRRIFANSCVLRQPEYFHANLIDDQCDAVWNLRLPVGYESEALFLEDSPVSCSALLFLYNKNALLRRDRWLLEAAQNIGVPILQLDIASLDILAYNLPSPWKMFETIPRRRNRTYMRYKVTDLH